MSFSIQVHFLKVYRGQRSKLVAAGVWPIVNLYSVSASFNANKDFNVAPKLEPHIYTIVP